jgi:hypothetical protein
MRLILRKQVQAERPAEAAVAMTMSTPIGTVSLFAIRRGYCKTAKAVCTLDSVHE